MNNIVFEKINIDGLISQHDTVLIALSGGADSVFLAEFLLSIRDKYSLVLKAAHVEHGIRGEESIADCKFVEAYCRKNHIECFTLHIDVLQESQNAGMGVEEYSRNRRYAFFNSIECNKIATAHNLNDNIETMLFRLIRGTSIKGLCAIPRVRGKIIRPLLSVSGSDIRHFLDENGITYCIDSTNNSNDYSRNYIRNKILPCFSEINTDYVNSVSRFIDSVNQDSDFIEAEARKAFEQAFSDNAMDINILKKYHIAVIKRVLIRFLFVYNLKTDELHLNKIADLLSSPSKVQISGGLFAVSTKKTLRIADLSETASETAFFIKKEKYSIKDFLNKCELYSEKFDFCCDCDKIIGSVSVRSRRNGDKISPAGRGCTKSLKKLFNELSIPVEHRNKIPVITDDSGVIGIYGCFADERVRISSKTKNVLAVFVSTEDNFQ